MGTNIFFERNEEEANLFVSKTMRITILFMILVFLLDVFHIFIIPISKMLTATIFGIIFLLIPTILVDIKKLNSKYIKYINITCSIMFVAILVLILNYHAVLMFIYPIAIGTIYFSQHLNIFTATTSIIVFSIAELLAYFLKITEDHNASSLSREILFLIAPRVIELVAISFIFYFLTKRTSNLLIKVIKEEEQSRILTNKSIQVANDLYASMSNLTNSTEQTTEKNKKIVELAASVSNASSETLSQLEEVTESMDSIASSIERLSQSNDHVTVLSKQVDTDSLTNANDMQNAMQSMQDIANSNKDCIEIMKQLNEKSNNIAKIIDVITSIAEQTNLLSLNASIESARAGEQGRGFGVVATEIGKLAQQSKDAVDDINDTIKDVITNIESALHFMSKNSKLTAIGLDLLTHAKQSTERVAHANHKITNSIEEVNNLSKEVSENSKTIASIVNTITTISSNNVSDMQQVNTATEENFLAMKDLNSIVLKLEYLATDLKSVVA